MSAAEHPESEWQTRKRRIDPRLDAAGWGLPARGTRPLHGPFRTEEEETAHGPADYALWLDNQIVGIVEAKKLTLGPQNVLTRAERYALGIRNSPFNKGRFKSLLRPSQCEQILCLKAKASGRMVQVD